MHLNAAASGPARTRIEEILKEHEDRDPQIEARHDPSWEILKAW